MKKSPLVLSRAQLFAMASAAACLFSVPVTEAAMMHADIDQRTYTDFAQNLGRYKATGVSTLLQAIRTQDGGIALVNKNGEQTGLLSLDQGMINFSGVEDMPGWFHGAGAALGNNFIVTAAHNSVFNASFGVSELGSNHAIKYGTIVNSEALGDYALYRQNKIFTDVVGAAMYSGIETNAEATGLVGETIYRAGGGVHYKFTDYSGTREHAGVAYTFLAGGMGVISGATFAGGSADTYRISWGMNISADGVNEENPIPITTNGGDSGSPNYIYNETTGQYEYLFALTGDTRYNWSIGSGAIAWTAETMANFSEEVDMSTTTKVLLNAVNAATDEKAATGTVTVGDTTIEFLGVASGSHTWKDLSGIKNNQNWYSYGNGYQNGIDGLGNTQNLIFNGSGSGNEHEIVLNATVDLGIGYTEFNDGKFTVKNADGGDFMLNSAGYVINKSAEVHVQLTNDEAYMREWRKNGEGALYIEGDGDNNILLTVGGSGKTYLSRNDGYAAYNVLASSGATVVIQDANQIARDFTFGLGGATLDMNGNSLNWYTSNDDVNAEGFSINALTDEAVITNSGTQTTTLTYKQSGETTYKGSFKDTTSGAVKIVADAGDDSVWTLNGIGTDLTQHDDSGLDVKSGKVVLAGTNTVHGKGSVNYSDEVFFSEDDWHYADAQTNVTVQSGATFELGSHARLKGDITVNEGTYIMREGVHHQMEYIEGGLLREDTYVWADYYGHHGNTTLNNSTLQVCFSEGTTANTTYTGNITGTGTLTVDAADGSLTLTGKNTFAGDRSVIGGTLIVKDADAAGSEQWTVEAKGVFAARDADGATTLSYINGNSSGVLALVKDQTTQVDVSGHQNLIIGALAGTEVQYGAEGTTEALKANDNVWRLGGGGGNLIVNYRLTGENKLILGNEHTKGTVTLANAQNDFTGGIDFMGSGVTLDYTSEAAIKNITLNLSYGNRVAMTSLLGNVAANSDGILLQYVADHDLNLSGHQNLSLGTDGNLNYTGKITVADDQAYRFSAAAGTFAVNTEIGGTHDIVVDAQTYTGGTVVLNNVKNFTGALTVTGYDSSKTTNTDGAITLSLTQDNVLDNAEKVTLKAGGTLYIGDTTQKITNLVSEAGSVLTGSVTGNQYYPTRSGTLHLTIDKLSDIQGNVIAGTIHKYGENTLELDGSTRLQYTELVIEEGDVKLTGDNAIAYSGSLNIKDHTLDLNGKTLTGGGVYAEDGAVIDASVSGSKIGAQIYAASGTATIKNGGNDVTVSGILSTNNGSALHLSGSGTWLFGYYYLNSENGTLHVDAPELKFTTSSTKVRGTLDLSSTEYGDDVTLNLASTGSSSQAVTFSEIQIGNKNLILKETAKNNTLITIGSLHGSGSAEWQASLNTTHSSRLVLNGEGTFSGNLSAVRTANGNGYNSFVELAHEKALQNATLTLEGVSGSNMALAISASDTQLQGLNGNAYTYAYGGAASATQGTTAPETTTDATLTITGGGTYNYQGTVSGLSVTMKGSGTQTFGGSDVSVKDISALAGTLEFTETPTLSGNLTLAQGATLKMGETFSLDSGHQLSLVAGKENAQATLSGTLVLNGGTLDFDGNILSATETRLNTTTEFGEAFSAQDIVLSDNEKLKNGTTYKLLDGNWTSRKAQLAADMPDYLSGSTFTANESGLFITIGFTDGLSEWQEDYTVFSDGKTVLFRDESATKTLNFSSATAATGARFANDETYTFSGNDVTLSDALTMDSGKLTLNNRLTTASYGSTGGELEIGATGELVLSGTQSGTVALENISGTGTLRVNFTAASDYANTLSTDSDFAGTTHIGSGNFNLDTSTFGNKLVLADSVNAQINSAATITADIELEGTSQIHQNSGNTLTVDGNVSGDTWNRRGGGTLNLNGAVNLSAFTTANGNNGTTTNFNGTAEIETITVDKNNITLGGTGTLSVGEFNVSGTVTLNGTGALSVGDFNVSGTVTLGGDDTARTMHVNGLILSYDVDEYYSSSNLNVASDTNLVITGESSGGTTGDFVLAAYGERHQLYDHTLNTISVDGNLTSNAAMTLMHNNASLTINDGGRLNLLKGLVLTGSCATDVMQKTTTATLNVADGGALYAAGGTQRSELVVTLASGSTLGAIGDAGSTVTFSNAMTVGTADTTGTFTIDTSANTADSDFRLISDTTEGATVDLTGALTWQGSTSLEVIGNGTLKHKSAFNNAAGIFVQENATLAVDTSATLTQATELNGGALALSDGASVTANLNVRSSGTIRATGTGTLSGTTTLNDEANMTYEVATHAELSSTQALVSENGRGTLIKTGAGTLNLNNANDAVAGFNAAEGTLNVQGTESYELDVLTVGANTVAGFYRGNTVSETEEAELNILGTASFAAGAHLNANLTLSSGSTLDVAETGLSMGSTVTLEQGILLSDDTLARANALKTGETLTLFTGADQLILMTQDGKTVFADTPETLITEEITQASTYFSNLSENSFELYYTSSTGTIGLLSVPEPSAFGLLAGLSALALVASRRRRSRR